MSLSSPATPVSRTRIHGRVSCSTCRRRKQRCELPDADDDAPGPRPSEQACRRCRLLGLTCEVDATSKRRAADEGTGLAAAHTTKRHKGSKSATYSPPNDTALITTWTPNDEVESPNAQPSTLLHGRPYAMLCAMANCIDTSTESIPWREAEQELSLLIAETPYLPSLETLVEGTNRGSPSHTFIISLAMALCSRGDDRDQVCRALQRVIFEAADSLITRQALVFALTYMPLGAVPGDPAPTQLSRGKGALLLATSLSRVPATTDDTEEVWCWLALCILQTQHALEQRPLQSLEIMQARAVAGLLMPTVQGPKLALCVRVMRLSVLADAIHRLRDVVHRACGQINHVDYGAQIAMIRQTAANELALHKHAPDRRHASLANGLESLFEDGLLLQAAMRTYVSIFQLSLQPNTPIRYRSESSVTVSDRHALAFSAGTDPDVIREFFRHRTSWLDPAWECVVERAEIIDDMFCLLAEWNEISAPGCLPVHRIASLAVDAASVIIEHQAAAIVMGVTMSKLKRLHRPSQRFVLLKRAAEAVRALEGDYGVAAVAANLIDAMARLAKRRVDALSSQIPTDQQAVFDSIIDELFAEAG